MLPYTRCGKIQKWFTKLTLSGRVLYTIKILPTIANYHADPDTTRVRYSARVIAATDRTDDTCAIVHV